VAFQKHYTRHRGMHDIGKSLVFELSLVVPA
jgi:hypothetical protein